VGNTIENKLHKIKVNIIVQLYLLCINTKQNTTDTMLSYHRDNVLQGALVLAKSGRPELRDNTLRIL